MINSTLIIPTENPTAIDDLKRALVTFDKVFLPSPEDRDFIPLNVYDNVRMKSLGFLTMPFGGTTWGPVRPLGKVEGHDQSFERLLDKSNHLIRERKLKFLVHQNILRRLLRLESPLRPTGVVHYLHMSVIVRYQKIKSSLI